MNKKNSVESHLEEFTCDANSLINIKLIRTEDEIDKCIGFSPQFTHQFYGESEKIFGYKNLKINLCFSAHSLTPYISSSYDAKIDITENILADNFEHSLIDKLPNVERDLESFKTVVKNDNCKCFGKLIDQYTLNDENVYEIFHITGVELESPAFQLFNERLQYLLLFFVDGSSFIDISDPSWEYFVIYQKYKDIDLSCKFATIGFMTVFNFFAYPDKIRKRISQVLILPPFQKHGHGERLLSVFYSTALANSTLKDITVEDPSDQFQILRDYVDCKTVLSLKEFDVDMVKKGLVKKFRRLVQSKLKISNQQTTRIYEILGLKFVNKSNVVEGMKYKYSIIKRLTDVFGKTKDFSVGNQAVFDMNDEDKSILFEREYERLEQSYSVIIRKLDNSFDK